MPIGQVRPASSFVDQGCFPKNRKCYAPSHVHKPIDMYCAIYASSIIGSARLQTHTFHFTSSNNGLHIDTKLTGTFYIFRQVLTYLYPMAVTVANALCRYTCENNHVEKLKFKDT